MAQLNLDLKDLDGQLKLEEVNACFAPSTSEWSRKIHANTAAEGAEKFATIRFAPLSQDLTVSVQSKEQVGFAKGQGPDEKRLALVQGVSRAVRFLAAILMDYNQVHGALANSGKGVGKIVVECLGDNLEKLVGTEANLTKPRIITLHYLTNKQFPGYLEKYCEATSQTAQLTEIRQMVPAAIEELKKNMKGNRITPLVMVYKHKQDGAESYGFTTSGVQALTPEARESADLLKEILDDAGLRNCQMMQIDLSSGNVMAFDADAKSFDLASAANALPTIGENNNSEASGKSKLQCQGCGEIKSKEAFSKAQLKVKAKARCADCVAGKMAGPSLSSSLAPPAEDGDTIAPLPTKKVSVADQLMQQTQRFVAEFFQVLQPFAAAKSASTGKGALFVFSRSPPADLLCLDKQKCRHPEIAKLHLCAHGDADRQFVVAWGGWIEQVGGFSATQLCANMKDSTKNLNDTLSRAKIDVSFPLVICCDPSGAMFPKEVSEAVREPKMRTAQQTGVFSVTVGFSDYSAMCDAGAHLSQLNMLDLNMDRD